MWGDTSLWFWLAFHWFMIEYLFVYLLVICMSIYVLCPFSNLECLFFLSSMSFLYIFDIDISCMICRFFLPSILLMVFFTLQKLKFDIVLITFAFVAFAFGVKSKKSLLRLISRSLLLMFSSGSFIVSALMFKFLIYFELTFMCDERWWSSFFLLHETVQVSQHHFEETVFLHCVCWLLLCKRIDHGLFLNSVQLIYNSLLLCRYCTVLSYSLYYSLRPRGVLPPLSFFLKIALVLKDFLLFRIDFRIFFFSILWKMSLEFWWLHWICRLLWVVWAF